ncbi:MAG: tRNA guanosine(34) transglycosylase Tgt [Candidatus Wildermuthbacteria bacterium]|nr:tRNA guanosine(34) transglycosylase Tgt [Candidatus Wildermuthbacteria bacterium]
MKFFEIKKQSKKSKARVGIIHTAHGDIHTPAFVPVATKGTLKTIPPREFQEIGVQVAFVNTFHLVSHPGANVIQKFGGIHAYAKLGIPLMSDSAGFQVFSLGGRKPFDSAQGDSQKRIKTHEGEEVPVKKISEEGVLFRAPRDGKEILFTPELSIKYQQQIGADLIMAFDECIYHGADYEYTKQATERTHRWLERCIKAKGSPSTLPRQARDRSGLQQFLYGIVQGGVFKDLREESAKFIGEQKVDGVAIGGVAVGETKKEIREQLRWVAPYLPEDKPVHLLGIGQSDDILDAVRYGVDTFDCVEPTRLARNGVVYTKRGRTFGRIDLNRRTYLANKNPIQKNCGCYACRNFSLSFIHHLFKERELLGHYLATWHNLYSFAEFFRNLREQIAAGKI